MSFDSVRGNQADAGEGVRGEHIQTSPAQFAVGAVRFEPHWSNTEDSMAASIIRLECQKDELNAEVALLREQAKILQAERDKLQVELRSVTALAEALAKAHGRPGK